MLKNIFSPVPKAKATYCTKDEQNTGILWVSGGPPDPFSLIAAGYMEENGLRCQAVNAVSLVGWE